MAVVHRRKGFKKNETHSYGECICGWKSGLRDDPEEADAMFVQHKEQ